MISFTSAMCVQVILLSLVTVSVSVSGISVNVSDCQHNRDCQTNEICDKEICRCDKNYVRFNHECVQVKSHGEDCFDNIQCEGSSMVCASDELDLQQNKFCVCDMFHIWNPAEKECLDISNISRISGNFREVYNVTGVIEKSAQKVFLGVVVAGLLFVSILLSFIGICSVYGCCTKHKKGRYGEEDLGQKHINEVAVIGLPGTYEAIETDFTDIGF